MAEPPAAATPYVFLSYASADREQVLAVDDALTVSRIVIVQSAIGAAGLPL